MVLVTIPKLYFKLVISPHKMGEESITMGTRKWAGPRLDLEGRNWGPKGPEKEGPKKAGTQGTAASAERSVKGCRHSQIVN